MTIHQRVLKWNKDREISEFSQRQNLVANLLEELTEFKRAKDESEKIDALCDIIVFSYGVTPLDADYFDFTDAKLLDSKHFAYLISEFDKRDDVDVVVKIIRLAYCEIQKMGYSGDIAMDETLKEIESRTGVYCLGKGKFVKDVGAYTRKEAMNKVGNFKEFREDENAYYFDGKRVVKWYKADYEKARIQE